MPKTQAIYAILVGDGFYVGQSTNLESRWYMHNLELRHGQHHARGLQHAWNAHQEACFVQLKSVDDKEELNRFENEYWDLLVSLGLNPLHSRPSKYTGRPEVPLSTKACQYCGEVFQAMRAQARRRKFCSQECSAKAHTGQVYSIVCPSCASIFSSKDSTKKYCNQKCYSASQALPTEKVVCLGCESEFSRKKISTVRQKYCSSSCWQKSRDRGRTTVKSVSKKCETCEDEFFITPNEDSKRKRRFCSLACSRNRRVKNG